MTFASGLICILLHCAGMLLLLLVGLYFPDKTQSFIGFLCLCPSTSSLLLLPLFLFGGSFFIFSLPPFLVFRTSPSAYAAYFFSLFVSFVNFVFVS